MAVYFLTDGNLIKIGYTEDITRRLAQLQTGNSRKLEVLSVIPSGTKKTERAIHRNWRMDRVRGEWFNDSPALRTKIKALTVQFNNSNAYTK